MKYVVKGAGAVELTQSHYVAAGGQASVYVKAGVAYKIYNDPKDSIPDAKFTALAAIKDPAVIKPDKLILDGTTPVGYTMAAISDNFSLCQLFTKTFRDRNNVTNDHIIHVVDELRQHVANVHAEKIIIVDLNELNILVSKSLDKTYLIDVDSYQVAGYPASVIMPSVRDYSVKASDFSPLSDWYSYGVLAFQLFIGVHPYKGTHPPSEVVRKDERMIYRMKRHQSAFGSDVTLPKCCYPFDVIPHHFRDWLKAVLHDGKRLPPPDIKGVSVLVVTPTVVVPLVSSGNILLTQVMDLDGWSLVSYAESSGRTLALTTKGGKRRIVLDGQVVAEVDAPAAGSASTHVGFTAKMNRPVTLSLGKTGGVAFIDHDLSRKPELLQFTAQQLARSGNRFYVKNGPRILEVEFSEMPAKTIASASHTVANVMEMASQLYEGVAIQNMIGSVFVSVFPKSKFGAQVRIPELDGYNIVDAKFSGGVLMVVGGKGGAAGKYDRLVFRFDPEYTTYDVRIISDVSSSAGINFVTLDSGVCICLNEEEKIEAFSAKKDAKGMKLVEDKALGSDIRLMQVGGKAGFERAGIVYQVTLK